MSTSHRMLRAVRGNAVLLLIAAFFSVFLLAGPANAASQPAATGSSVVAEENWVKPANVCNLDTRKLGRASENTFLPVNRWSASSTDLHSRLAGDFWGDVPQKLQRNMTDQTLMQVGNTAWELATNATTWANRFCFADTVAFRIDKAVGAMGKAILNSGVVAVLAVAAILMLLWRQRRTGLDARGWTKMLATLGLFVVMVNAAMVSDEQGGFGKMSPGWMVANTSNAITALAELPSKPFNGIAAERNDWSPESKVSRASCYHYVNQLHAKYRGSYQGVAGADVPESMSLMWENSGLAIYQITQFGDNPFTQKVFCHLLERKSSVVNNGDHAQLVKGLTGDGKLRGDALTFWQDPDNTKEDQAIIAYASCKYDGGWKAEGYWAASGKKVNNEDCTKAFQLKEADNGGASDKFNWEDPASDTISNSKDVPTIKGGPWDKQNPVQDFVLSFHGHKSNDASSALLLYAIVSWVNAIVFFMLAFAVFIAKIGLLFMGLYLMFAALKDVVTIDGDSAFVNAFKQTAGIAMYAFGVGVVLSMVAMVTRLIGSIGAESAAGSPMMKMMWLGAAPLIAIFMVRWMLKKLFNAPHMFKPSSAFAWGTAGGAIGGAAVGGLDNVMDRIGQAGKARARGAAGSAVDRAGFSGAAAKLGGNRLKGRAPKQGIDSASVGAAAVGAGAAAAGALGPKGIASKNRTDAKLAGGAVAGMSPKEIRRAASQQRDVDARRAAKITKHDAASLKAQGLPSRWRTGTSPDGSDKAGRFAAFQRWDHRLGNASMAERGSMLAQAVGTPLKKAWSGIGAGLETARDNPLYAARRVASTGKKLAIGSGAALAGVSFGAPVVAAAGVIAAKKGYDKLSEKVSVMGREPVNEQQIADAGRFVESQREMQSPGLSAGETPTEQLTPPTGGADTQEKVDGGPQEHEPTSPSGEPRAPHEPWPDPPSPAGSANATQSTRQTDDGGSKPAGEDHPEGRRPTTRSPRSSEPSDAPGIGADRNSDPRQR